MSTERELPARGRMVPLKLYEELRDDRDRARELLAYLLSDAAHTDWGDCEPWDSIVEAQRYLDRRKR